MSRQPLLLIADDNELLRAACSTALERVGYRVLLASSGREAIEVARTRFPDVILLDLSMPGLGGRQTARVLHRDPRTAEIPVVAFTGRVPRHAREELRADGFCACAEKPQTVARLDALVRACIASAGEPGVWLEPPEPDATREALKEAC